MNQDYLKLFPNQVTEHRPEECVGLTVSDLAGNLLRQPCDPGFTYGATEHLMNVVPNEGGTDPLSGMQSALIYGVLPEAAADFSALSTSELYEANFANYASDDKKLARTFAMKGVKTLYDYSDIVYHLSVGIGGAALAMRWYESFNTPNADGTLPPPSGIYSNHCVAVYESTPKGLRIKSWQGTIGDGGYLYLNEAQFNVTHFASYAFDPTSWRWLSLVQVALQHTSAIPEILPILQSLS